MSEYSERLHDVVLLGRFIGRAESIRSDETGQFVAAKFVPCATLAATLTTRHLYFDAGMGTITIHPVGGESVVFDAIQLLKHLDPVVDHTITRRVFRCLGVDFGTFTVHYWEAQESRQVMRVLDFKPSDHWPHGQAGELEIDFERDELSVLSRNNQIDRRLTFGLSAVAHEIQTLENKAKYGD